MERNVLLNRQPLGESEKVPWLWMIDDFILNEYKARQLWEKREYSAAIECTKTAADAALARSDQAGWWRMTCLMAECQLELGLMDESAETSLKLTSHEMTLADPELLARANAIRSAGLRSLGHLPEALAAAREAAVNFPDTAYGSRGKLEAQQVLVAVLAEAGNLDDAWEEAETLTGMITDETSPEKAGKGYWVVGNVAFLTGRHWEAVRFHTLASESLSLINDLGLWALFNKASAFMRLSANLVEPETLQCIERAEMALSISGGSPQDELDMEIIRAHWRYVTGEFEAAKTQMAAALEQVHSMTPLSEGDGRLLYARILQETGDTEMAIEEAMASLQVFDNAGAGLRAQQAKEFLAGVGHRVS
ncbi:MAG: hypothetical protein ABS910_02620 [Arthrobacter sp.]